MDGIDFGNPLILAVIGAAAFVVGKLLFKGDSAIEDRRRRAIELAGKFREYGFTRLPTVFEAYGVGDYSGTFRAIHELHDVLSDTEKRQAEFEKVFRLILERKLTNPAEREAFLKLVNDLQAMTAAGKDPKEIAQAIAHQTIQNALQTSLGKELLTRDGPKTQLLDLGVLDKLKGILPGLFNSAAAPAPAAPAATAPAGDASASGTSQAA